MTTRSNVRDVGLLKAPEDDDKDDEEEDSDSENSTPEKAEPRSLFDNLKNSLPGQDEICVLKSSFQQSLLFGLIGALVVTLVAASSLAVMSKSSVSAGWSRTKVPNSNLLGLYHLKIPPSSLSLPSGTEGISTLRPGNTGEAYFLRYYIIPTEVITVKKSDDKGSNHSEVRTVLMRPRRRLFHKPRVLKQEIIDMAREDILLPLKERWLGRIDAFNRFMKGPEKHGSKDTNLAAIQHNSSYTQQMSFSSAVLKIDPTADTDHIRKESISHTLQTIRENTPQLPRVTKPSGYSVCPSSLFCYYTIPPTIQTMDVACAKYCGRCFESNAELRRAVQDYLEDPSYTSRVATTYGWPIQNWCLSLLSNFSHVFANTDFNEDISKWDMSAATSLAHMFRNSSFNQQLRWKDTSNVEDMSFFLADATNFNQPLGGIDVSNIKTMKATLSGASNMNQDLSSWKTAKVQDMSLLFERATKFSGDGLSAWNTANCKSMRGMFMNASSFKGDISTWQTDRVQDFSNTFRGAFKFNNDISNWTVSRATTMEGMFQGAVSFEQNISAWRPNPKTVNLENMFTGATKFSRCYREEIWRTWDHRSYLTSFMFGEKCDNRTMGT